MCLLSANPVSESYILPSVIRSFPPTFARKSRMNKRILLHYAYRLRAVHHSVCCSTFNRNALTPAFLPIVVRRCSKAFITAFARSSGNT